ncbi:uracil-DNA glycosylase [Anatilimnocola sp. NA78]|uniref:uracil-DNA glycosylase n=1 Tax=Anatilimnocola sp. NA78 TaxID=3415683 RepID=UPI003CE4AE24
MAAIEPEWQSLQQQIIACERCPRLREYCQQIASDKRKAYLAWDYWGKPVPNFGIAPVGLLIVGLAPAAHGANRTGRMFTGDRSGEWLYRALHRAGFANQGHSENIDDGLQLTGCTVTAMCHCAPPDNKPLPEEISACEPWLKQTFDLARPRVMLALGQLAWKATLAQARERQWFTAKKLPDFGHGAEVSLAGDRRLLGSYHPSQQNTFTGRLTEPMFDAIFTRARELLG